MIEYRSYKNYSKQSFISHLKQANFEIVNDEQDINTAIHKWNELFTDIAGCHAPIKKLRAKVVQTPWHTADLHRTMQDHDYHRHKAVKSNSPYHWKLYKKLKNYINKAVKKCKSDYYTKPNQEQRKLWWKTLNDMSSRKSHFSLSCIVADGIFPIVEKLNDHFSSIGYKLACKIKNKS